MKNLSVVFHPAFFFTAIQLTPLVSWFFISDKYFSIFLQGYDKAEFGIISAGLYLILILSFVLGVRVATAYISEQSGNAHPISSHVGFIRWLHYLSLCLAIFSAIFVIVAITRGNIDLYDTLLRGNANTFKIVLYSTSPYFQILLMGRHLILTALISWMILCYYHTPPKTLFLIPLIAITLFLFSSSRLIIIGMLLIVSLFYLFRKKIRLSSIIMVFCMICGLVVVFGAGVWLRSTGTWFAITESENIFIAVISEFFGYFVSPVNYSIALIQERAVFYLDNIFQFTFNVIYSVLNLPVNNEHLLLIRRYYNPGLNQIGLLGQWYTGYGPFLFIPSFLFGFASGAAYLQYGKGNLAGLLIYPLVLIALFDSFRGFLLFQNILAANMVFIGLVWMLYCLLKFIVADHCSPK